MARLTIHRTFALVLLCAALAIIVSITHAAMAQSASYLQHQAPINPLDDPAVLESAIKYAVLDPIGDQLVDDIAADLLASMPRDAMSLKHAIDEQRYYATELRQYQIAHGTVSEPSSGYLIIPAFGAFGVGLYFRRRHQAKARKAIAARTRQ